MTPSMSGNDINESHFTKYPGSKLRTLSCQSLIPSLQFFIKSLIFFDFCSLNIGCSLRAKRPGRLNVHDKRLGYMKGVRVLSSLVDKRAGQRRLFVAHGTRSKSCIHAVTALGCAAATAAKSRVEIDESVALFCSISGSSAVVFGGEGLDWLSVMGALAGLGGAGALRIAEKLALYDLF